jgi:hypothetical protein
MEHSVATRRALLGGAAAASIPLLATATSAHAQANQGSVVLNPSSSTQNVIQPQSASVLPLTVQAQSGQTAHLQEWQASDGTVMTAVTADNGRIIRPNTGSGHGPFVWELGGQTFNGTWDPVSYFGYNVQNLNTPIVSGEPTAAYVLEGDYNDGSKHTMEQYLELHSSGGVNMRPLFFQVKRDATTPETFLTGSELVGNPLRIKVPMTGQGTPEQPAATMMKVAPNSTTIYAPNGSSDNILGVQAPAGYNSKLWLGRASSNRLFQITTATDYRADIYVNDATPLIMYSNPKGIPGSGSITVGGVYDNSAVGLFCVNRNDPGVKGLVSRARTAQTASLFEVQGADSSLFSGFDKNGYFLTQKNVAPAGTDIANNQLFMWFDPTPGAARLVINARDAAGNLVSGAVALS